MSELLASDLITPDAAQEPLLGMASVSILKAVPLTRLSLRVREGARADAGAAFGTDIPDVPLRASLAGKRAALWMGPDEWTLLAPEDELKSLFEALEANLSGHPHALVDVSERSEAIIVSGRKADWLLNTGIFIDFSNEAFPVGTVTRTLFHKVPVVVFKTGPDTYVVDVWVSFMEYVSGLLVEAAAELKAA